MREREKRMLSKKIIDTDWFLELPISAQALYFHLCMRADDEGFITNIKSVIKMLGVKEDDLAILIMKKFVIPFQSGVIVIKHWNMHNSLKNIEPTQFDEERKLLSLDEEGNYHIIDSSNGSNLNIYNGNKFFNNLLPSNSTSTSSSKKTMFLNINNTSNIYSMSDEPSENGSKNGSNDGSNEPKVVQINGSSSSNNKINELFNQFWNAYPRKQKKSTCLKWFEKNKPSQELVNKMLNTIENFKYSDQWTKDNGQYIPLPSTWLNGGCWDDEVDINIEKTNDVINTAPTNNDNTNTTKKVKDMNNEEQEEWAKSIYGYNISSFEMYKIITQKINEEITEENPNIDYEIEHLWDDLKDI